MPVTARFFPAALAVAQVDQRTMAVVSIGSTFSVTCNTKVFTYTAVSTSATAEAALFVTAFNACGIAEMVEQLASAVGAVISFTSQTPGRPFTFTYAAGGTGSPTFAGSTTTANTGPYNWDNANNWSTAAVPVNGDTVILDQAAYPIRYGIAQSAVTLALLSVPASWTGLVGLPDTNSGGYAEYRARYLAIGATSCQIGQGAGKGSAMLRIDFGATQTLCQIYGSGAASTSGVEPIQIKGTHASNVVSVLGKAIVAIAGYGGDTSTVATLNVSGSARVRCGSGLTLTTLVQTGGSVDLSAGLTTVTKNGGSLMLRAGNVTTISDISGTTFYAGTGTVTTWNVQGSVADFTLDLRTRTVTTMNIWPGATVNDPYKTVTWTNPIVLSGGALLSTVTLNVGANRSVAIS